MNSTKIEMPVIDNNDTAVAPSSISNYTPGPWRACGCDRGGCDCGLVWSETVDMPVAEALHKIEDMGVISREQQKANARLIAESPEMLEAIIELRPTLMLSSEIAARRLIDVLVKLGIELWTNPADDHKCLLCDQHIPHGNCDPGS